MDKRLLLLFLTTVPLVQSAYGQAGVPDVPQSLDLTNESAEVPSPPVNRMQVFGKRSKGLEAPESEAINMLYSLDQIPYYLSSSDRFLFSSAKANSERNTQGNVAFENVCRRAIFLNDRGYTTDDAVNFGRQLDVAEETVSKIVVDTYHAMLDSLSDEGAKSVEEAKVEIHKHMGSLDYSWEQQVQIDPDIISNYARNCSLSQ